MVWDQYILQVYVINHGVRPVCITGLCIKPWGETSIYIYKPWCQRPVCAVENQSLNLWVMRWVGVRDRLSFTPFIWIHQEDILRLTDSYRFCYFRLTQLKQITIPRLELASSTLAAKIEDCFIFIVIYFAALPAVEEGSCCLLCARIIGYVSVNVPVLCRCPVGTTCKTSA